MKHNLSLIVYNGIEIENVYRKDWALPDITAEEFDIMKHTGKVFMYPEKEMDNQGMYIWQYCTPENDEERNKLIEMGKWGSIDTPTK